MAAMLPCAWCLSGIAPGPGHDCATETTVGYTNGEFVTAYTTKVTEQRDHFSTGSQRGDQTGKGRYDLVPREVVDRYAKLLERGAVAYGDNNWRLGQPYSRVISSMLRHAYQAAAGMTDEDHLAAVVFNAGALITYQEMIVRGELPAELDDLPKAA